MTVFIPVQLISTQRGELAALFALTNEALQGVQSPAELDLQAIKVAPAGGVAHRREVLSRKTPETHAARPAAEKFWSAISSSVRANSPRVVRAQHESQSRQAQRFGEILANSLRHLRNHVRDAGNRTQAQEVVATYRSKIVPRVGASISLRSRLA